MFIALLLGAFGWGLAAGTYEVFPYEIVRGVKNTIDGDDNARDPAEYIGNPVATEASVGDDGWGTRADNVVIGDSLVANGRIEEMFAGASVANRGVGGDTIQGALDRLPAILALEPKRAVVFTGHNDILYRNPQAEIVSRFAQLLDRLTAAGVEPVVLSVLVCGDFAACDANKRAATVSLNAELEALAARNDAIFVDVNAAMSDENGVRPEMTWDGLHLGGEGYRTWRDLVSRHLYRDGDTAS